MRKSLKEWKIGRFPDFPAFHLSTLTPTLSVLTVANQWQSNSKGTAQVGLALNPNLAAVLLGNGFDNRQAEAGTGQVI
jgi:hypothetical protein